MSRLDIEIPPEPRIMPADYAGRYSVRVEATPHSKKITLEEDGKPIAVLSPYDAAGVAGLLQWASQ